VVQQATKLAHGGSGDVKPEWFEDLFGRRLERYDKVKKDMEGEAIEQERLLEQIRVSHISCPSTSQLTP
jgi:programmed cell death 6-interacting protein